MLKYGRGAFEDPTILRATGAQSDNPPIERDDFRETGINDVADIAAIFERFFFGCEADDSTIPQAYARQTLPEGIALQPILGSDLGHWDVRDMREVIPEAGELLDDGLVSKDDFRRFACDNPIRLHGGMNPTFFDGTIVEAYAREVLDDERR